MGLVSESAGALLDRWQVIIVSGIALLLALALYGVVSPSLGNSNPDFSSHVRGGVEAWLKEGFLPRRSKNDIHSRNGSGANKS